MLEGLADGENVANKLQQVQKAPIDPNVYETNGIFEDILRIAGSQEANLGGAAGATATESSIAEGSRISRSEEHTSELQSLRRISHAVFCLKKKQRAQDATTITHSTCDNHHERH